VHFKTSLILCQGQLSYFPMSNVMDSTIGRDICFWFI